MALLLNGKTGRLKTEIIRSLQTTDAKAAERRALSHIEEGHRLVDQARRVLRDGAPASISAEQVLALIREHEVELLERDEKLRRKGVGLDLKQAVMRPDGEGMTEDDFALYRNMINFLDQEVRGQAAKMRPREMVRLSVNRAIENRDMVLHPDDPAWRELELGFLKAERQAFDRIKARLAGETISTPARAAEHGGVTISAALRRWADGG